MKRAQLPPLELWQFDNLSGISSIRHFVSDRDSDGEGEFTLSLSSHPDKNFVRQNRSKVAAALGVAPEKLFFPSQIHETRIVNVTAATTVEELAGTDALITNERGIAVAVMSADCVPILLYDHKHHAAAAVHAGWRGTVAHILSKTLTAMQETWGTTGSHLVAAIGPSVCVQSYEVGEEVVQAVRAAFPRADQLLEPRHNGKAMLNLWEANRMQLLDFGVPAEQIEVSDLCTVIHNQYFFSARKGDSGRFAAGIFLQ